MSDYDCVVSVFEHVQQALQDLTAKLATATASLAQVCPLPPPHIHMHTCTHSHTRYFDSCARVLMVLMCRRVHAGD
jgi:hypothetical protein